MIVKAMMGTAYTSDHEKHADYTLYDGVKKCTKGTDEEDCPLLHLTYKDGSHESFYLGTVGNVYLMNDEGKTIQTFIQCREAA